MKRTPHNRKNISTRSISTLTHSIFEDENFNEVFKLNLSTVYTGKMDIQSLKNIHKGSIQIIDQSKKLEGKGKIVSGLKKTVKHIHELVDLLTLKHTIDLKRMDNDKRYKALINSSYRNYYNFYLKLSRIRQNIFKAVVKLQQEMITQAMSSQAIAS